MTPSITCQNRYQWIGPDGGHKIGMLIHGHAWSEVWLMQHYHDRSWFELVEPRHVSPYPSEAIEEPTK